MEFFQAIILLLLGAGAGHFFQRRIEALKAERAELSAEHARIDAAHARLTDHRREIYTAILDPYIEVLHELGRGLPATQANQRLGSVDHRKAAFQLKMIGTDAVVRAFNSFARYILDAQITKREEPGEVLRRWAALIYAIRRDLGGPNTELSEAEMIVDWVADINSLYPDVPEAQALPAGTFTLRAGAEVGASVPIAGHEIHMHRLEELRQLAQKFREGTATDEELIDIFHRIPDAPGAEMLADPEAELVEDGRRVSSYKPKEFLDAIRRSRTNDALPGDADILQELIRLLKSIRGRRIAVLNPRTGKRFEIRA